MSEMIGLMQAVIGPGYDAADAAMLLDLALASEVDPLHWCAVHLGMDQSEVARRAAGWLGLAYYNVVPRLASAKLVPPRLEILAEIRMFRVHLLDREVAFASPDFFGILRLKKAYEAKPLLHQQVCIVPPSALRDLLIEAAQTALIDGARQTLARSWPYAAAQLDLPRGVRWGFAGSLMFLALLILLAPLANQLWLLPLWLLLVVLPIVLRLCALLTSPQAPISPDLKLDDLDLPVYSILVPLRDEANMVDQLYMSLGRLDYPREKLEIIFVVENRSPETIGAVRRHLGDARFALAVVPDAAPRTKPKALDFALPLCRGEFVVVYDAEDQPEPDQLRRVVSQFRQEPDVHCIQARLVIANGRCGVLPALFAGEYAGLFTVTLPALASWGAVMPLGGTSNHFRLQTLRALGGWDAYNVTEDADLGVRLARRNLRTSTISSITFEDAPTRMGVWTGQRTRWMKGWMQTFVVHNRKPLRLLSDLGWRRFALFQITILGMLLGPFLHTAFAAICVLQFWLFGTDMFLPGPWLIACLGIFVVGYGVAIATNLLGLARTGQTGLIWQQLLLPFYWLLIAMATLRAMYEFVLRPFHWWKTPHQASTSGQANPASQEAGMPAVLRSEQNRA